MSTRATYCFHPVANSWVQKEFTVYIHSDGYPEGAALYFWRTLAAESKGNFATQFIRANPEAELTERHDAHGDTDFRYNVFGDGPTAIINVFKRVKDTETFNPKGKWINVWSGEVKDFLVAHDQFLLDPKYSEGWSPLVKLHVRYCDRWLNAHLAQKLLDERFGLLSNLRSWSARGNTNSANWQNNIDDLRTLVNAFPSLATDEIRGWLTPEPIVVEAKC